MIKKNKVLVIMSDDDLDVAGVISQDPAIEVEVIWNFTNWDDIPKGYKTLARTWGFRPADDFEDEAASKAQE
jgi:hypothetical protein